MRIDKILYLLPLATSILFAQSTTTGKEVFVKNCSKCHSTILGVSNDGGYDNNYITPAPYISDLVKKLKSETKSKEEFGKFIKEYIKNPEKRKSIYGKVAIKKFGLMPSLKGVIGDEEKSLLIDYLYTLDRENLKTEEKKSIKESDPREKLFTKNCSKCHSTILGVSNDGGYDNNYITPAPYISDLVKKLKSETKSKEEFGKFIKEYIKNPEKRKSIYGKVAIKKFGLMPSLKGALRDDEIVELTEYLYERY